MKGGQIGANCSSDPASPFKCSSTITNLACDVTNTCHCIFPFKSDPVNQNCDQLQPGYYYNPYHGISKNYKFKIGFIF